jgi:hypothetical protein
MEYQNLIPYTLISLAVFLVFFLICREIVCWYLKINRTLIVLEEIRDLLKYSAQAPKAGNRAEPIIGDINQL